MKYAKSLTLIAAILVLTSCGRAKTKSETFSSSEQIISSETIVSSQNETTSSENTPSSVVLSSSDNVSSSEISSSTEQSSSMNSSSGELIYSSEAPSSSEDPISSAENPSSSEAPTTHYYNGYYDALVSWTDGEDLKNQLYAIIRNGYQPLSYTDPNYATNIHADHSKYDFEYLDAVYSEEHVFKTATNRGWQREHAFCASLMCGSLTANAVNNKGRATDFHNLFAANASANSSRGNKNYGNADTTSLTYTNRTTSNGDDGYSFDPVNFEPGNKDKGRLARAIFYMATMYKDDEEDTANGITMKGLRVVEEPVAYTAGESGAFAIGNLSHLLSWNNSYQVDYLEMQHNISVYTDTDNPCGYAQGNRNPYVDFPGLVDYVYGNKKEQAGTINDVIASASYLNCEETSLSHYAIKEAKREYGYGETLSANDYKVVAVNKNYTYSEVSENVSNSLINHVFSNNDGDVADATISTPIETLSYQIVLNPMALCSSGAIVITPTGINKKQKGVDQSVTYGGYNFYLNFETPFDTTSTNFTINNIWSNGSGSEVIGTTFGSKDRVLTKLTIKTKDSYTVDAAYAKAFVGNNESTYRLTILVGSTVLLSQASFSNTDTGKVYGNSVATPLTGQVTYIFEGSSNLKINSIAFNAISV